MLSIALDELLPLAAAAKLLPKNNNGKTPSIQTLRRWYQRGSHNIFLDVTFVGGRAYVTRKALDEFVAQRNASARKTVASSPSIATAKADAKLRQLGA